MQIEKKEKDRRETQEMVDQATKTHETQANKWSPSSFLIAVYFSSVIYSTVKFSTHVTVS